MPEAVGVARIMRMSVAAAYRRQGIGRRLLDALCKTAVTLGYRQVVLETTAGWQDAVNFYRRYGFQEVGSWAGDIHFVYTLRPFDFDQNEVNQFSPPHQF